MMLWLILRAREQLGKGKETKRNGGTADDILSRRETYDACECDGQTKLKSKIALKNKIRLTIRR
jgi:hypothetical protein